MKGYSPKMLELVKNADPDQFGVKFAKFCVANNLSVVTVSEQLGVTRMTLYRWFAGGNVHKDNRDAIKKFMAKFTS